MKDLKITTENIEKNKEQITAILIKEIGNENLKSAMNLLKSAAELEEIFNENNTIEDEIKEITNGDCFQNRKMKTADYIAELNDNNSSTFAFNHTSKI